MREYSIDIAILLNKILNKKRYEYEYKKTLQYWRN